MNAQRTGALRDALARTEPQIRQRLAGTWFAEIPAPELNTVDYQYQTFSSDGIFTYESRICGGLANICSDFSGHGLWGATGTPDGDITTFVVVSDLNRDRECFGATLRFVDDYTFQNGFGVLWRRVQ